jgi:hypothetical protein
LYSQVDVSEKHTVSIFRVEVALPESGGIFIGLEERNADGISQSETMDEGQWSEPFQKRVMR